MIAAWKTEIKNNGAVGSSFIVQSQQEYYYSSWDSGIVVFLKRVKMLVNCNIMDTDSFLPAGPSHCCIVARFDKIASQSVTRPAHIDLSQHCLECFCGKNCMVL